MVLTSFLGLFYIFLTILLLILFFYEKDDWVKTFHFLGIVTLVALMINLAVWQTSVDNGYSLQSEKVIVDSLNLNSLVFDSNEVINRNDVYHTIRFENFDEKTINKYTQSNFCFNYNTSTDGGNIVRIASTTKTISDYIYLINNTAGTKCAKINNTYIYKGANLGVFCEDCSSGNTLLLPKYVGTAVSEIQINKTNPLVYTVSLNNPHLFYVESFFPPVKLVNKNFNWFLFFLSVHILMYGFRFIYNFVKEGTDY